MPLGSTSKDRELLNRVFAKVASQHTSWPSVGLVVGADAVQAVIILPRPHARNRQLLTEAAVAAGISGRVRRLRFDGNCTRFQNGQFGPAPAVQWQFLDGALSHHGAQR